MFRKNKYLTLAFVVLFALSGTGLPLFVHLCNTMNEMSFESCAMCTHKTNNDIPSFSRTNDCCDTKQISPSISDKYIISKSQQDEQLYSITALPFVINIEQPLVISSFAHSGISPPNQTDIPLFIINSSFLI